MFRKNKDFGINKLVKVAQNFPHWNMNWIVRGNGYKYNNGNVNPNTGKNLHSTKNTITIKKVNLMNDKEIQIILSDLKIFRDRV